MLNLIRYPATAAMLLIVVGWPDFTRIPTRAGAGLSTGTFGVAFREPANVSSGDTGALDAGLQQLLTTPEVGAHELRVISPTVLELYRVTTEAAGARPTTWSFVSESGQLSLPGAADIVVTAAGVRKHLNGIGFKRRVVYAPLRRRDLRIGNWLYLRMSESVAPEATVEVTNPTGTLWRPEIRYTCRADRLRYSPAIHVNQVGYQLEADKAAMVGYYLGSMGELDLDARAGFDLVDSMSGRTVYHGPLKPRPDEGWTYESRPYRNVLEANFSAFTKPGCYRLVVQGLGASTPFRIDEGIAAAFARAYALGLYHQRCGAPNELPFTRFVHAACHTAPALVPTLQNSEVQRQLAGESSNFRDNPRHSAPQLKDTNSSLYPFVRQGFIDVSGGHHDAGDYSKYTINSAQLIHSLIFAVDNFPGVADLDNLGLPESGDGKSDVMQIAKWEADFLAKMQDDDGGFYFLVYPRDRAYEEDVLPDHGDPQVVFPKTTAVTAAAVAALAEMASSPRFKHAFPADSALYLKKARKGWEFLERAWAKYGMDGSYQKITHYGDTFMHDDEIAWAATEMWLATREPKYHARLLAGFDPSDKNTLHWGWERMFDSYGCAIRSYAFGARSGRVREADLDPVFLSKCREQILAAANDKIHWYEQSAYGTSFPIETKRVRAAGWYFSTAQAFDIAVAQVLDPQPNRMRAIWGNINFEAGANPNNVVFVTGLGWKRQHEIVDQYALNDRRELPPSGIPLGSIQEGFMYLNLYKGELGALSFPQDGVAKDPYPFYDRWGDSFNVATEFTIPIQGRSLAVAAWLMAQSPVKSQAWRCAAGKLIGLDGEVRVGKPRTVALAAAGLNLRNAVIVWEAEGRRPEFGKTYRFTARGAGAQWVEAEAQLPDGRRVYGVRDFQATP